MKSNLNMYSPRCLYTGGLWVQLDFQSTSSKGITEEHSVMKSSVFNLLQQTYQLHTLSSGLVSLCYVWEIGLLASNLVAQLLPLYHTIFNPPHNHSISPELIKAFIRMAVQTRPSLRPLLGGFIRQIRMCGDREEREYWDRLLTSLAIESLLGCLLSERTVNLHVQDVLEYAKAEELLTVWDGVLASRYKRKTGGDKKIKTFWQSESDEDNPLPVETSFASMLPVSRFIVSSSSRLLYSGLCETTAKPSVQCGSHSEVKDNEMAVVSFVFGKDPFITSAKSGLLPSRFCRSLSRS